MLILIIGVAPAFGEDQEFATAVPGLSLVFPKDHGKHPTFQTEWWYFTGNLESEGGRRWGFQVTFFRRALFKEPIAIGSSWVVRDVYPAHFALTDVQSNRFFHGELLSREGPGLAGAAINDLKVHVRDWSANRENDQIRLKARQNGHALDLLLISKKPPVLHGNSGYSRKGEAENQASYYYSLTHLQAAGTLTFQGASHQVQGSAWMDHEFGSSMLLAGQVGWDWFSLQLDDGSELMVSYLRRKDGTREKPFGTFISKDGKAIDLANESIMISPQGKWTSPHTKAVYPSGWTVHIREQKIILEIAPLIRDQELSSGDFNRLTYWEGAVEANGTRNGNPVYGRGYVELTGYAQSMAGHL
jgi:predicted secreted hydrolase